MGINALTLHEGGFFFKKILFKSPRMIFCSILDKTIIQMKINWKVQLVEGLKVSTTCRNEMLQLRERETSKRVTEKCEEEKMKKKMEKESILTTTFFRRRWRRCYLPLRQLGSASSPSVLGGWAAPFRPCHSQQHPSLPRQIHLQGAWENTLHILSLTFRFLHVTKNYWLSFYSFHENPCSG